SCRPGRPCQSADLCSVLAQPKRPNSGAWTTDTVSRLTLWLPPALLLWEQRLRRIAARTQSLSRARCAGSAETPARSRPALRHPSGWAWTARCTSAS
ncbi:unnamed protein product, partial [Gulo gulo]